MRSGRIFLLPVLLFFVQCQNTNDSDQLPARDNFSYLAANFQKPPVEYSTAPFWVWNDLVTREKIDSQLLEFKNRDISQVFIHPRPGLITEYLSDEWFELCNYALEKGKELDMKVWLYDENSFPSGFAGGHVQAEMPESYTGGSAITIRRGITIDRRKMDDYLVVLKKNGKQFEKVELLPDVIDDDYFAFELIKEKNSGWYGGFAYVDLLIPGVTEKFIEVTMKGYEQAIGSEFGKAVPGIFTDEPNIAPRGPEKGVGYSPVLFPEFEKRWGYDLKVHLPALFMEAGDYQKVRYHYYRLLLELFIERWSKPWYEYTESKNLVWTGHYWEHGWPSPHHGGDNMAMYAWHQMPGIDMLFNTFEHRPDQFGNVRAVKELSSVANQLGRQRTLSETYGGAGWELTFEDMKRLGDWEYALGVNFMNQHLSYMTLKGRRKGDFPQSFLTHAPYWQDYGTLATYFSRLSLALSQGKQVNNILVIEPTTTAWMYYNPTGDRSRLDTISSRFRSLVDNLEKLKLEYDLGSENIIKDHGKVEGNRFIIGERSYEYLVLPPEMENLDETTWQLLLDYVKNGGYVLSFTVPSYVNGEISNAVNLLANTHENWLQVNTLYNLDLYYALMKPDFIVENPDAIEGKVFHHRRQFSDGQLIFWANFNQEGSSAIKFSALGEAVSELDLLTGEIRRIPAEVSDNLADVRFDLPATGSKLFFVHKEQPFAGLEIKPEKPVNWYQVKTGDTKVEATDLNTLTIDYLDLTVQGQQFNDLYFSMAADSAYKLNGLETYGRSGYNPWAVAVQYKTNILDMGEKFGPRSGYSATYKFEVARGFQPDDLQAVIEWGELYEVNINGNQIQPIPGKHWLDHSFLVYDLTGWVEPGINELTLSIQPMNIHAEIEPVYILGNFSLQLQDRGFMVAPPQPLEIGTWKNQGRPFYSQAVKYSKELEAAVGAAYKIRLNDWHGTVARVLVNDQKAGIIGWLPYEFDLTSHLEPGRNKITVEVVGSLKNLLGPHHNVNRQGIVTPWSWFFGPQNMPAGEAYHQLDYGLFEDFELLTDKSKTINQAAELR